MIEIKGSYKVDIHSLVSIILPNVSFGSLVFARNPTTKIGGSKLTIWKKLNGARFGDPTVPIRFRTDN